MPHPYLSFNTLFHLCTTVLCHFPSPWPQLEHILALGYDCGTSSFITAVVFLFNTSHCGICVQGQRRGSWRVFWRFRIHKSIVLGFVWLGLREEKGNHNPSMVIALLTLNMASFQSGSFTYPHCGLVYHHLKVTLFGYVSGCVTEQTGLFKHL